MTEFYVYDPYDRLVKTANRELALAIDFEREDHAEVMYRSEIPGFGRNFQPKQRADFVRDAAKAIAAAEWHARNTSWSWSKPMPLTFAECNCLIGNKLNALKLVGYFGRSVKLSKWDVRHPVFDVFCSGVTDYSFAPPDILADQALRQMFPPRPLAGLTTPLHWSLAQAMGA